MGAANINDRSMLGFRDSEIALRIVGEATEPSRMDGQPWAACRFARSLRMCVVCPHRTAPPPQGAREAHGDESDAVCNPWFS